jgi:flagellar basal-body rod protein FlgF
MLNELYAVALTSMQQDTQRLSSIAMNMANISTPAYKREIPVSRAFSQIFAEAKLSDSSQSSVSQGSEIRLDKRPGTLRITSQPLDLAIVGDAFFEVLTPSGSAYTRNGKFHLDSKGKLVTEDGFSVMGKSGEIQLKTGKPVINSLGRITDPASGVDSVGLATSQIKLVHLDNPESMQKLGNSLYLANESARAVVEDSVEVRQGALENSNVNTATEMVQLMQTMRHFESVQRALQGYDEMIGSAIRKLGDM